MTTASGDFGLTMNESRVVAQYAAESAEDVYPSFAEVCPNDPRPRLAFDAAWQFANGARRTNVNATR